MRSLAERRVDVAKFHLQCGCDVVGYVGVRSRASGLHGLAAVLDCGQDVVVDRHQSGGVFGEVAIVGNHHCQRLPGIAHLVASERVLRAHDPDRRIGHQVRDALGAHRLGQIVGGQHGVYARQRERRLRVDRTDAGVAVRAAHEAGIERAWQRHVVDEAAAPCEQRRVFKARYPRAEMLGTHARLTMLAR